MPKIMLSSGNSCVIFYSKESVLRDGKLSDAQNAKTASRPRNSLIFMGELNLSQSIPSLLTPGA